LGRPSETATIGGLGWGKQDTNIRRTVGVLTETPGMYDNLSAEYNPAHFCRALRSPKDVPGQIEEVSQDAWLWDRRFDAAGTFSQGNEAKAGDWGARALLHEPHILFWTSQPVGLESRKAPISWRDFYWLN